MKFSFFDLVFEITDDKIFWRSFGKLDFDVDNPFVEVGVAGEIKPSHMGAKLVCSSEGDRLKYISHSICAKKLTIIQRSTVVETVTVFEYLSDAHAFRAYTEVKNITDGDVTLEDVSSLVLPSLCSCDNTDGMYITRFWQGHHTECQPRRLSFDDLGFFGNAYQPAQQKKIEHTNIGSWSTKEALPEAIIENLNLDIALMFQIESSSSWHYEISDRAAKTYLYLGGASNSLASWHKTLSSGESYRTSSVSLAISRDVQGVIAEMTKHRRAMRGVFPADQSLPTIFNEYMHLSWDSPTAENTKIYAPAVADLGVEYYVIDCGWHDEEPGDKIYPYVGGWRESRARFPEGVRKTTDFIRSLRMKAGLWIEPEIVGVLCKKMIEYYGDECFITRHGKKVAVHNRYFLDYRHPRVVEYMTETIRYMVEDLGADYIKFDYNQDLGVGTDKDSDSFGEGLESCTAAFFSWVDSVKKKFPDVVFEGCASGGMRMDYSALAHFSLVSTSDQIDYLKYPYIAANILSSVIPEQAAVWSYPVACPAEDVDDDRIIINMVNSFLGRMHLASHVGKLNSHQLSLVKEGVDCYKSFSDAKKVALPIFPLGFARFGDKKVAAGFLSGKKIYLALWCLGEDTEISLDLGEKISDARLTYPASCPNAKFKTDGTCLSVSFDRAKTAAFFEVDIER